MSFDWNLSSEEEGLEDFLQKQTKKQDVKVKEDKKETTSPAAVYRTTTTEDLSSEDEDSVEWEDVLEESHEESSQDDQKPSAKNDGGALPRPVTIDLNQKEEEIEAKKRRKGKRKRRHTFRVETMPYLVQSLLWNLHRAHLLALSSRAVLSSRVASCEEVLASALSLIPQGGVPDVSAASVHSNNNPSLQTLRDFAVWYFDLIHETAQRREHRRRANVAAGAPTARRSQRRRAQGEQQHPPPTDAVSSAAGILDYASYLSSTHDEDPQLTAAVEQSWTVSDQTVLLAAMARSMGWRARYVQAMDPVSPDLDVGHPLLSTVKNLFSGVFVGGNSYAKRMRTDMLETATSEEQRGSDDQKLLGWIEILCHDGKAKSGHRWVHIDPVNRLFDAPHKIENLLSERSSKKRGILPYALAVEHVGLEETRLRLTDVTPRYAHSWLASLRRRGVARHKNCSIEDEVHNSWWSWTLRKINDFHRPPGANQRGTPARPRSGCSAEDAIMIDVDDQQGTPASLKSGSSVQDAIALETEEDDERKPSAVSKLADAFEDIDKHEREELKESANNEVIPTSKAAFQKHPMYVIPSVLGKAEVLSPDASKRICGVFKGELVYRRADVSTALPAKKWLYQGRKVLDEELNRPVKRVKARKKPASKNFQALRSYGVGDTNDGSEARRAQDIEEASKPLDDGTENLYGKFQTEPWSPSPVGPADPIPVNEHKNVDLKLLNPGLVHIDRPGLAKVAKKLGIPYAPCLIGFGGHGGNRTPEIRGIVVHQHNSGLIREAGVEVMSHAREEEEKTRRRAVDLRWKKLMVGLLTKDRLEKEYG